MRRIERGPEPLGGTQPRVSYRRRRLSRVIRRCRTIPTAAHPRRLAPAPRHADRHRSGLAGCSCNRAAAAPTRQPDDPPKNSPPPRPLRHLRLRSSRQQGSLPRMRNSDPIKGNRTMHRLFTLASLLSLLFCVAMIALWVRSFLRADNVYGDVPTKDGFSVKAEYGLISQRGELYAFFGVVQVPQPLDVDHIRRYVHRRYPPKTFVWPDLNPCAGFGYLKQLQEFDWVSHSTGIRARDADDSHGSGLSIDGMTYQILVPTWAIVLASGALPTVGVMHWRRIRVAIRSGHCVKCGYDLRASKDRCPECGTPIQKSAGVPSDGRTGSCRT